MDWERKLISRVARDGLIAELIGLGVGYEHFSLNEDDKPGTAAEIYQFLCNHLSNYGGAPSFEVVASAFPGYNFEDSRDNIRYCTVEFLRAVKDKEVRKLLFDVAGVLDGDNAGDYLDNIDERLIHEIQEMSNRIPKEHVAKFSDMQTRVNYYNSIKFAGPDDKRQAIKYPFPEANLYTQGIMPHEFVTIAGWSGLGKSFLGLLICYHAYLQGKTPLIISLEMGAEAVNKRLDVMATNISTNALKALKLPEADTEKWGAFAKAAQQERKEHDIIILDKLTHCNASTVYAETLKYTPDLVLVDYISLMDPEPGFKGQNWEKVTDLTRRLKSQARMMNIPVIGIAQTNINSAKEGAAGDNVAYSRSIFQDSDVMWGLHADEDMKSNKRMELRLLKNREGQNANFDLYWDPDTGIFRTFNPLRDFLTSSVPNVSE